VAEKAGANKGDDDLSLAAGISMNPASLALVHHGPDLYLHLRYYDGVEWSPKDVRTMHEITSRFVAQLHGIFGCSSIVESST